jgi:recombination DNA repair RAD52 pathway protein
MEDKLQKIPLVSQSEMALVENNILNGQQLAFLVKNTPAKYVRKRPAKGGGEWTFVSGGYVKKMLNFVFGWNWSFEVMEQLIIHDEAIVKGKLTVTSNGVTVVKMQFGNKDIIYRKLQQGETERKPLSIGNDLKSAATDALKKCAAELGIAADIYNAQDFQAVNVVIDDENITHESLSELFEIKKEELSAIELSNATRILEHKEEKSYAKLHKQLQAL